MGDFITRWRDRTEKSNVRFMVLKTDYLETFYIHFDFLCILLTSSEMIGRACEVNTRVDLSN